MSGSSGHNFIASLAADIRALHTGIRRNAEQIARDAIEAGKLLIEAKSLLQHGEWEPWLREHVAIAPRTARLYMRLARSGLEIGNVADLGLNAAARMIAGDREDHEQPPLQPPSLADLPLCLASPPKPGQALSFEVDGPHRWIIIPSRSSIQASTTSWCSAPTTTSERP
jgi:DUF3102 family protein